MSGSDDLAHQDRRISRRDLLRRSGGAAMGLWIAPAVVSVRFTAAPGSPPPKEESNLSFVALLLARGRDRYRVKFDRDGSAFLTECGRNVPLPCSDTLQQGHPSVLNVCPEGVTPSFDEGAGTITVTLGVFDVVDFVVKCGECCEGPGDGDQPRVPKKGSPSITFEQCAGVSATCTP